MKLYVMMLPLVVVDCISDQSAHPHVKPPPPRAWIMQSPRLADIAEQDYFLSQREGYHYAKTTVESPEVY